MEHKFNSNLQSYLRIVQASLNYDRSFTVLATVIKIVNYDRKTFILQASENQKNVTVDFFA